MHTHTETVNFSLCFYTFICPFFAHRFLFCTSDFLVNIAKADLTLKDKELNTSLHLASSKVSWRPLYASVLFAVCLSVFILLKIFLPGKCCRSNLGWGREHCYKLFAKSASRFSKLRNGCLLWQLKHKEGKRREIVENPSRFYQIISL